MTSEAPLRSLKRSYLFSAFSAVIGILYPIVTLAYVARVMGPEALGKYYFANSLALYFVFAACLGIPIYGTREIARVRGNPAELKAVFSHLFLINFISSLVVGLVYVVVVFSVPGFRAEAGLFVILGLLIFSNAFSFEYLYMGFERQDQIAYRSLLSKLVSLPLIFALVRNAGDYLWYAGISVFVVLLNSILGIRGLKHWEMPSLAEWGALRRHIRPLLLITVSMLFVNVYINLDSVLVGLMANPHDVGLYNAAIRPGRLIAMLMASMTSAALPRLSYYLAGGTDVRVQRELKKKSLELLLMLAIPITLTFMVCSAPVIRVMYGAQFSGAASPLILAAPIVILNCLSTYHAYQILVPMGKESVLAYMAIAAAVVSVVLNLALIPILGFQGAILGAMAAEATALAVQFIFIRKAGRGLLVFPTEIWKFLLAGAVLAATQALLIPRAGDSLPGLGAGWLFSGAIYFGILWVLKEPLVRQTTARFLARR